MGFDPMHVRAAIWAFFGVMSAGIVSAAVTEQMSEDIAAATTARVDALPSIWINGHPYLSFENLEARVAFELANK